MGSVVLGRTGEMRNPGRLTGRSLSARSVAISVALALVGAACGGDDTTADTTATTSTSGTTVQATTVTTEGAAGSVEVVITFDRSGCTYSGPDRATLDDEIRLTVVNETENSVRVGLKLIPPDRVGEFVPLVGTDFDYSPELSIRPVISADAGPLSQKSSSSYLAGSGTYVVECVLKEGATPVHSWWPVVVEVTR